MPIKLPTTLIEELIHLEKLDKKDAKTFSEIAKKEDKELEQVLTERGVLPEQELLEIKSRLYKLPAISIEGVEIDQAALKEISEETAIFYKMAPFIKLGDTLKVGIVNPEDIDALEALKFIASDRNFRIEKNVISLRDFELLIKNYGSLSAEVEKALKSLSEEIGKEKEITTKTLEEITAEGAVTKIVASVIKYT